MSNERYKFIMEYQFASDYASEQLWHQAFEKFKKDLKTFDEKEAKK